MVDRAAAESGASKSRQRRARYAVAGAIVIAAASLVGWAQASESVDNQVRFLLSASTVAGALLLLVFWLVVTASARWSRRLLVLGALGLVAALSAAAVRIDEVSGDIVPKLAWRWTPKPDVALAGQLANLLAPAETVDLTTTTPDDSPQFLGPDRVAMFAGVELARDWAATPPRELWRRPIGAAWSSFAVVGDCAVTQEQRADQELVVCYDLRTGEPLWSHADPGRFDEVLAGAGPRSTPTIAAGRVYAMGALGRLNCLEGPTGKVIWSHDVLAQNQAPNLQWGKCCSPLVVDNLVVVSAGGPAGKSLVAYAAETGDVAWHAGDDPSSYSSPMLVTLGGQRQIVIINQESVVGHDPATGAILWRQAWPGPNPKCAQPLPIDDERVLVSAGYGVGSAMLRVSRGSDATWSVEQVWASENVRNLRSKFADMVRQGPNLYALDDGILACLDVDTGARRWKRGRYGHGQLLLVGDLLLIQAEAGELALVAADPESHRELARIPALPGKTWNNPTLSGRRLLVRNHEEAACYELPLADAAQVADVAHP